MDLSLGVCQKQVAKPTGGDVTVIVYGNMCYLKLIYVNVISAYHEAYKALLQM